MSVTASTYVWEHSKQSGSKLVVMLALADYANPETGECWPSIETLAEKCRMTTRYLRTILTGLQKDGEVQRIRGAGQRTETGATNRYVLCGYQEWIKQVKAIKREGVNNSSSHAGQGVNNSSARGEQEFHQGVNNSSPKPLIEPSRNRQKEKDKASDDATGFTHRQKTDLIKAWWDALPELNRPANVTPDNMYQFKGFVEAAGIALSRGLTPEKLTAYIKAQTAPRGFYHDKTLAFGKALNDAPVWCKVHYRPPQSKIESESFYSGDDEIDPRIKDQFEDFVKAMSQ